VQCLQLPLLLWRESLKHELGLSSKLGQLDFDSSIHRLQPVKASESHANFDATTATRVAEASSVFIALLTYSSCSVGKRFVEIDVLASLTLSLSGFRSAALH